jgi:hypothetical protein
MLIGTNADPHHGFLPADIASSRVALVRFPLWRGFDYGSYIAGLLAAGVEPVYVFDSSSFTPSEWANQRFLRRLRFWSAGIPPPTYVQAGTEPDGTGATSSTQIRSDYFRLVRNCRTVWPNAIVLGAGLSRIDFTYYGSEADAECFHPYTQDAQSVGALIGEIRNHTGKPLWATEVGVPSRFYPTVAERAAWHSEMYLELWRLGIGAAIQFPYGNVMERDFDGMVDAGGEITQVWAATEGAVDAVAGEL